MRLVLLIFSALVLISCIKVGPAEDIQVEVTPERLARGEYLVESVTGCVDCHSIRDYSYYAGPVVEAGRGGGGEIGDEEMGFPGTLVSPNITPYALGEWTDGELIRAITEGVSKDGTPLFPIMPYHKYGKMSTEDIYSIVAYLRSMEPVENDLPRTDLKFPMSLIVRMIPTESNLLSETPKPGTGAYNAYVTNLAVCSDCHTPKDDKGRDLEGMTMAGGFEMQMPDGIRIVTANITPHETGIGKWTKEQFIARFKTFNNDSLAHQAIQPGQKNTIMPWSYYASMTEDDLGAIFDHLRSLPAVDHEITRYPEN